MKLLKKKKLSNRTIFFISLGHGLLMLIAMLLYLSLPFSIDQERVLITLSSAVKDFLIKPDSVDKSRFLFVSVSWEKQLIEKKDPKTDASIGYIDITNRESLGTFLQRINNNPLNHKFLIVDVQFYLETKYDSLLAAELKNVQNCLVSYHKDANDKPRHPIFEAPLGLSDMQTQHSAEEEELVLKYHLVQADTIKTTPLLMYEKLSGDTLEPKMFYDKIGKRYIFNSYILNHPIRAGNLIADWKNNYNYIYMNELLSFPEPFFDEIVKDQIIIVGDFENQDIHKTIYGEMPGPIILVNAFLSLERGDNTLSSLFMLLLLVAFTLISFKSIKVKDPVTVFLEKKLNIDEDSFFADFFVDTSFYLVYFVIISLISYFLFNIHITILILSVYMSILEKTIVFFDKRMKA